MSLETIWESNCKEKVPEWIKWNMTGTENAKFILCRKVNQSVISNLTIMPNDALTEPSVCEEVSKCRFLGKELGTSLNVSPTFVRPQVNFC